MKNAKIIVSLQVMLLIGVLIFTGGIAYNAKSSIQPAVPAEAAKNLAIRQEGYELISPVRYAAYQNNLASMDSVIIAAQTLREQRIAPVNAQILDIPGAKELYLVPIVINEQTKETILLLMSPALDQPPAVMAMIDIDEELSNALNIIVGFPPSGSIEAAIADTGTERTSSAGRLLTDLNIYTSQLYEMRQSGTAAEALRLVFQANVLVVLSEIQGIAGTIDLKDNPETEQILKNLSADEDISINNLATAVLDKIYETGIKSSSPGHDQEIASVMKSVADAQRDFLAGVSVVSDADFSAISDADFSAISGLDPKALEQYISKLRNAIQTLDSMRISFPETATAVSAQLSLMQTTANVIEISSNIAETHSQIDLALAEGVKIEQPKGTIVINDKEIPDNQRILLEMLDKNGTYIQALEAKLNCTIRLLSQYNPDADSAKYMIAISKTKIADIERHININQVVDGYLPLEQIIVFAKGLLLYNQDTRPVLDSIITQMYRFITNSPISPALLNAFLQQSVFVLDLPVPASIDEAHYEQLHRQALAALIAA
jgi:molybdopterin-guanine dinucleotide biosynthesis protein